MTIRARAALAEAQTMLVNSGRGQAKSYGDRLRGYPPNQLDEDLLGALREPLRLVWRLCWHKRGRCRRRSTTGR